MTPCALSPTLAHHYVLESGSSAVLGICKHCGGEKLHTPHEFGTAAANYRAKGKPPASGRKRGTHCPAGHAWTPENTYTAPNGVWQCKECRRANQRRLDHRRNRATRAAKRRGAVSRGKVTP